MIRNRQLSALLKNLSSFLTLHKSTELIYITSLLFTLLMLACSPTKRFAEKKENEIKVESESKPEDESVISSIPGMNFSSVRVLLISSPSLEKIRIESAVHLMQNGNKIALVKAGNFLVCRDLGGQVQIEINDNEFNGTEFNLTAAGEDKIIKLNGNRYRGEIKITTTQNSINIINILDPEDYVRGVLAKEMPIGKDGENFEALKALAVCIRTYALQKVRDGKIYFDLYSDTRDQVYGGVNAENQLTNRASDETKDLILKYGDNPAIVYYHSTCGGYTENSENVFTKEGIPYLQSQEDGSEPFCRISPRYQWKEIYSRELIISRLKNYSLLDDGEYEVADISIISKFTSGRVNELELVILDESGMEKQIMLRGNEIRGILRTADNKNILWSTMFDIQSESDNVILEGRGFGHGVGLCQWGAISLSRNGKTFREILNHYYPGTEVFDIND